MFLCDPCVKKLQIPVKISIVKSAGRCEDCGKTSVCWDVRPLEQVCVDPLTLMPVFKITDDMISRLYDYREIILGAALKKDNCFCWLQVMATMGVQDIRVYSLDTTVGILMDDLLELDDRISMKRIGQVMLADQVCPDLHYLYEAAFKFVQAGVVNGLSYRLVDFMRHTAFMEEREKQKHRDFVKHYGRRFS